MVKRFLSITMQELVYAKNRTLARLEGQSAAFQYTQDKQRMTNKDYEDALDHCSQIFQMMCGLSFITDGRYELDTNPVSKAQLMLEAEYDLLMKEAA